MMNDDLMEYTAYPSLKKKSVEKLFAEAVDLREEKEAIKERINKLNEKIGIALMQAGVKSVIYKDRRVSLVESEGRRTLSKQMLMENGVDAETIAASMKQGKPNTTVSIAKVDSNGKNKAKK